MDETDPKPRRLKPPAPTMEELRARFGRALRDQNFWTLMDELEGQAAPEEAPPTVVAFPSERLEPQESSPTQPGRVIPGRFPKR